MRWAALACWILLATVARAESPGGDSLEQWLEDKENSGVFVVDGSFVHDIGELQLNITNWGLIGSKPLLDAPYSNAPSAMWPAGSGVDYLFAAGLWIGGIKNGVPLVSTGQLETELLPTSNPIDTLFEMRAGDPGGARYPLPGEDDDNDGQTNEEIVDGIDNDGDGEIDEDYARIGDQQFRCRFSDVEPVISELHPDHEPLGVEVVQESYQWDSPRLDDVVVLDYTIRNVGNSVIDGLTVGLFADPDIGRRDSGRVSEDDLIGRANRSVQDRKGGRINIDIVYMYDCDRDDRGTDGYIGFFFVERSIRSFQYFLGTSSFDRGGNPANDEERYQVLTEGADQIFPDGCEDAGDYRFVIASGPGSRLSPGQSVRMRMGVVMGESVDDLVENAAEVTLTSFGEWFDRDGDPLTGVHGRETQVCASWFGPPGPQNPIFEFFLDCFHAFPAGTLPPEVAAEDLDSQGCTYINGDCGFEASRGAGDARCREEAAWPEFVLGGCTGIRGREFNVRWLAARPPPRPDLRAAAGNNRIRLFWSSRPEEERHPQAGVPIFESYRIWRADGWERPLGSSVETGPSSENWRRLAEFDEVSTFINFEGEVQERLPLGSNTGLGFLLYTPAVLREGSAEQQEFADLADLIERIAIENRTLDPDVPLRYRDARGVVTVLGQRYPQLGAWECCTAEIDTLFWDQKGRRFYQYVDDSPLNGLLYFYSVTATTISIDNRGNVIGYGAEGRPLSNFVYITPQSSAQTAEQRSALGQNIFVVPNPATRESLSNFSQLDPNQDDPTGVRVEFRNLPVSRNTVSIFTTSGDLVQTLRHDGRQGQGSLSWNLVTRNGQEIVSGIYLYSVESEDSAFDRVIGRFVVIR